MNSIIDFPDPHDTAAARLCHAFGQPLRTLAAWGPGEVRGLLDAVQQAAQAGLWCLGWLRYEAAAAFDTAYADALHATPEGRPLAWFASQRRGGRTHGRAGFRSLVAG